MGSSESSVISHSKTTINDPNTGREVVNKVGEYTLKTNVSGLKSNPITQQHSLEVNRVTNELKCGVDGAMEDQTKEVEHHTNKKDDQTKETKSGSIFSRGKLAFRSIVDSLGSSEITVTRNDSITVTSPLDGSKVIAQRNEIEENGELKHSRHTVEQIPSPYDPNQERKLWERNYQKPNTNQHVADLLNPAISGPTQKQTNTCCFM